MSGKLVITELFFLYQIGNPLLKLDRDVPAVYEYYWSHGMISDEIGLTIMNGCSFEDYTFASPHNESVACNNALSQANSVIGDYINNYDVILDVCYPSLVEQELRLKKTVTLQHFCIVFSQQFVVHFVSDTLICLI